MNGNELREQTSEELVLLYETTTRELQELRVKRKIGDTGEQPLRLRTARREVARIKTIMQEREIAAGETA